MTIADLIYRCKVKLQELSPYGEGLAQIDITSGDAQNISAGLVVLRPERDEQPMEVYIKNCIQESYIDILSMAPTDLIPCKELDVLNIYPIKNQNGSGYIVLPSDFFKLNRFKMVGWERPVLQTIDQSSQKYLQQYNDYIRGGFSAPICAIVNQDNEIRLEYYSLPKSLKEHRIEYGSYIPKLSILWEDDKSLISLDERLVAVLVYLIVYRVQLIYGQIDLAERTKQMAIEEMELIKLSRSL